MCFVFMWEQTATCANYVINWLVFITEMKSVYCAERTGSLSKAVCCIYLRTNSNLCHLQHKLNGFYNRDKCSLCSMNWVFKWSSLHFVFKKLKQFYGTCGGSSYHRDIKKCTHTTEFAMHIWIIRFHLLLLYSCIAAYVHSWWTVSWEPSAW